MGGGGGEGLEAGSCNHPGLGEPGSLLGSERDEQCSRLTQQGATALCLTPRLQRRTEDPEGLLQSGGPQGLGQASNTQVEKEKEVS